MTTEFWDAVNFTHGANPPREDWVKPKRRTAAESERCYGVLRQFVAHMKGQPDVRFVTAKDLLAIYGTPVARPADRKAIAEQLGRRITFQEVQGQMMSPADMLMALLGVEPGVVDGPTAGGTTTYAQPSIPAGAFAKTTADAADFVRRNQRLPNQVYVGAATLSLADFAATLAGAMLMPGTEVQVVHGQIEFERYFGTDPRKDFNWVIHPEGFNGANLLDLGRLQGWTLKPATIAAAKR